MWPSSMSSVLLQNHVGRALAALAVVGFAACAPPPEGPTADHGAAYLGLVPGTTLTYDAGPGLTESHELRDSGVLFAGGLAIDVVARQNGFAEDARTLTLGVDLAQVSIVRFFDCLARCGQPDQPIAFLNWPLVAGDVVAGEATVTETTGTATTVHRESHRTTVGAPQSVTVGAGTFDAFPVSWQRTTEQPSGAESAESAALWFVPDVGLVKHQAFDGTTLSLTIAPGG